MPSKKSKNFRTGSLATVFLCDMYKTKAKNSFWQTLNLLTGPEWKKTQKNDVDEWVENVVEKREYDNILDEDEIQPESELCDDMVTEKTLLVKEPIVSRKEFFKSLEVDTINCTYVSFSYQFSFFFFSNFYFDKQLNHF